MTRFSLFFVRVLFFCLFLGSYANAQNKPTLIHHKTQFRGVWIATVRNLDWPSKPGLSVRQLKKEFITQLDELRKINMNAVIVQVRPVGDAMYPTPYEPWSEYLSGTQGIHPKAGFDPLAFMVEETHRRCMEFHAWFNPYRAAKNTIIEDLSQDHVYFKHPEWFVEYGDQLYFDPGMVPARKFVEKVITDVITRYDIDAIHFDDYYYPYRVEGEEFPDSASFARFGRDFRSEEKEDWRRENINQLVQELHDTITQLKPWVHFGISPFGVWRNKSKDPKGSDTHTLQTNYDDLFGDALTWVGKGWLDYIIPQCYQYMGRPIMDYRVVTRWWNKHHANVNYYIGQGPFRLGNPERGLPWTDGNEIDRQLHFNDSISDLLGSAYFRSTTFLENPIGISDTLKNKFYRYPALPPVSHHDTERSCLALIRDVQVKSTRKKVILNFDIRSLNEIRYIVIYQNRKIDDPKSILGIYPPIKSKIKFARGDKKPATLYATLIDKYRIESEAFKIEIVE